MKILITGVTGFIGKNVLEEFIGKKNDITAIIRSEQSKKRIPEYTDKIKTVAIDLADTNALSRFLDANSFDTIIHIGALLSSRKFSKNIFYKVNVDATEQFLINAKKNNSKMIYCSSVGVFGTIPNELPANNQTTKNPDNLYHKTKYLSEKLVEKYSLAGTRCVVIRPSITYGVGDKGFPYTLIKLIDKHLLPVSLQKFKIHLTNITLLKMSFKKVVDLDFPSGKTFIVADKNPVVFQDLVEFIHSRLYKKNYPSSRYIHPKFFKFGERTAKFFKNGAWETRFKLLSQSWYYQVSETYEALNLKKVETIPAINSLIDWYNQTRR